MVMKQSINAPRGLRYMLRMMGNPILGPSQIYGDNASLINHTSIPESELRKKSDFVCNHSVGESVAMGESLKGNIPSSENIAGLMTKDTYG